MNTRWYCGLLLDLPPDTRRRLSMQLRRAMRTGSLPSRRDWKRTVNAAWGFYGTRAA